MKVTAYNSPDRDHAEHVREVRAALEDPPTIAMRYLNASAPYTRKAPDGVRAKPIEVTARGSKVSTPARSESGMRVAWEWLGRDIKIHSIDVSDTSSEYDITLVFKVR